MKSHAKPKRRAHKPTVSARRHAVRRAPAAVAEPPQGRETFTAMETGRPDRDEGRGPLGQEGEGEAQNDQLAALEELEPDLREEDQ
jgi:hypothetical protein